MEPSALDGKTSSTGAQDVGCIGARDVDSESDAESHDWAEKPAPKVPGKLELPVMELEEKERYRHPAGTWKIWENQWFYMTQTPGWIDIKCWMKMPFRTVTHGMGTTNMSKTITPYHYGDLWENPWRSKLLLRSWCIWRARWQGWARAKECRAREVQSQVDRLIADLRDAHVQEGLALVKPLLASVSGHQLLVRWSSDVVQAILGS